MPITIEQYANYVTTTMACVKKYPKIEQYVLYGSNTPNSESTEKAQNNLSKFGHVVERSVRMFIVIRELIGYPISINDDPYVETMCLAHENPLLAEVWEYPLELLVEILEAYVVLLMILSSKNLPLMNTNTPINNYKAIQIFSNYMYLKNPIILPLDENDLPPMISFVIALFHIPEAYDGEYEYSDDDDVIITEEKNIEEVKLHIEEKIKLNEGFNEGVNIIVEKIHKKQKTQQSLSAVVEPVFIDPVLIDPVAVEKKKKTKKPKAVKVLPNVSDDPVLVDPVLVDPVAAVEKKKTKKPKAAKVDLELVET